MGKVIGSGTGIGMGTLTWTVTLTVPRDTSGIGQCFPTLYIINTSLVARSGKYLSENHTPPPPPQTENIFPLLLRYAKIYFLHTLFGFTFASFCIYFILLSSNFLIYLLACLFFPSHFPLFYLPLFRFPPQITN